MTIKVFSPTIGLKGLPCWAVAPDAWAVAPGAFGPLPPGAVGEIDMCWSCVAQAQAKLKSLPPNLFVTWCPSGGRRRLTTFFVMDFVALEKGKGGGHVASSGVEHATQVTISVC